MNFLVEPNLYAVNGPGCDKYTAPCDCDAVRELCGGDWGT